MKSELRCFNELGLKVFENELNEIRTHNKTQIDQELLSDNRYSSVPFNNCYIEKKTLLLKKDLIEYIYPIVNSLGIDNLQRNIGLWSWLSAFFFDSICPINDQGKRKVKDIPLYILNTDEWGRFYRHLIASPFFMKKELGEISKFYLVGNSDIHGEHFEQLAAQQEYATSTGVIEAALLLYWDEKGGNLKKGARGKRNEQGVVRRFTAVLRQLDLTYDLNSMTGEHILELLPNEFNHWID